MLTVELKQRGDVKSIWHKGMFRASKDSSLIIVVVEDGYGGGLSVLILRDLKNKESGLNVDGSDVEFWLKACPVVIEDVNLILKGTTE